MMATDLTRHRTPCSIAEQQGTAPVTRSRTPWLSCRAGETAGMPRNAFLPARSTGARGSAPPPILSAERALFKQLFLGPHGFSHRRGFDRRVQFLIDPWVRSVHRLDLLPGAGDDHLGPLAPL